MRASVTTASAWRLGIRGKLFLLSLALILACVGVVDLYLSSTLSSSITERTEAELAIRVALVERAVATLDAPVDDLASFDALADELGARAAARVTVVTAAGRVIGDSEVGLAGLAGVDDHRGRAEVRAAREVGRGADVRVSPTTGRRTMYAASRVQGARGDSLVARVGLSLDEVERAVAASRRLVLLGAALASLVAVALSSLAAELASAPARRIIDAATRMARGELSTRTSPRGTDELSELGRALDHLAASLSSSIDQLRREHGLVQGILESMREGVMLLDGQGRVALVNASLREMISLGADVTGRTLLESVRHAELARLLDAARAAESAVDGEVELGGLKPRRLMVRASRHEPSGGLLAVFVDVTDMRRLEALRREFVTSASHELRTPTSSILSAAETLRDIGARDPQAARRFVDIIARNAERLARLVDDLLVLSRLESRQFALAPEHADVGEVVSRVLAQHRERADERRVSLAAALPAEAARAWFDRRALEAALTHLVDNAVKYVPEGASVTVRVAPGVVATRVTVEDTGAGIDADHLPRLFERFYRVDRGRSRDVGGTGLGLSIVKHLVEAMGGEVSVDSAPGRGATFGLSLPNDAPPSAPTSAPPAP